MKRTLIFLCLLPFCSAADQVCRMVPQQKVRFKIPSDIRFPPLSPEQVKDQDFVIEQFMKDSAGRPVSFLVRAPNGGVHLAVGHSMESSFGQSTWRYVLESVCPSGDPDIYEQMLAAEERSWLDKLRALAAERRSLPKDKVLCRPKSSVQISLDDLSFAQSVKPRPEINSFQLLGQVLFENDAPAEFQNVAFSSEDGPRWRKAEAGMYLIKDGAGRIHAVKHEQLAGPSQSKLRQSHFRCRPTEKQTGNPVIREITPEALKREAPATIEH